MSAKDGGNGVRPVVYETHMHTWLCNHAIGQLTDYAAAAHRRGLKGIIVTCHNPLPDGYAAESRMRSTDFPAYLEMVEEARREWAGRVDVRLGLECDFVPGMASFLEKQVRSAPFHYLLGSVHPFGPEYHAAYGRGDSRQFFATYYEHLALAAETGWYDCISHPDIVKNIFPDDWDARRLLPNIGRSLDRIARAGIAMELNTSGLYKEIPEMNPGRRILKEMFRRDIPVVVGADAHDPGRVADRFEEAYDLLEDVGYRRVCYHLDRRRRELPISEARRSLLPATDRRGRVA